MAADYCRGMADITPTSAPLAAPAQGWVARSIRKVLWIGVPFNLLVALMLVFPDTLGGLAALPPLGSEFYRWMLVYFVALFAATYAWLAVQPTISQPLVGLAALGKMGVFVVSLVCLLRGDVGVRTFLVALVDMAFALYFMAWLRAAGRGREHH